MSEDLMRYDLLAQDALRGVVRLALQRVKRDGLPGEHHFFIAFNTNHPDVSLSERLHEKYENEMTIVLQHQFWNLHITEQHFEVELSFDNIPEKLSIPFAAIKGFFDPSVQFGLQFEMAETAGDQILPETDEPDTSIMQAPENLNADLSEMSTSDAPADASNDDSKVVSLDSFRKK